MKQATAKRSISRSIFFPQLDVSILLKSSLTKQIKITFFHDIFIEIFFKYSVINIQKSKIMSLVTIVYNKCNSYMVLPYIFKIIISQTGKQNLNLGFLMHFYYLDGR